MPPQRQTSPRTKTKTVKTARLAAASTVKAGDHVQTNAREKSRVVTGAFATDTGKLRITFETGSEKIVLPEDQVIVTDIEKVEVPA